MKERAYWLDYMRITATFLVIMIHAASQYVYKTGIEFWAGNFYESISRMSVPLFVMISGSLIIGKTDSYQNVFTKRIKKVLFPLIIWSLIYFIYRLIKTSIFDQELEMIETLKDILSLKQGLHLWFLYMLIGLYLLTPLLNKYFQHSNKKDQTIFILICLGIFIYHFFLPILVIIPGFDFVNFSGFILYFISGYYLYQYFRPNSKGVLFLIILLFIIGFFATFFGKYISMEEGYSTLSFYSYLSPNVLLMTMATFILFMIGKDAFKKNSKKVIALSNAAFGIYLVHPIVLQTLSYLIFMRIKITVWIGIPLQVILAFIISFGIIWIIQRFKYSSYIVGI